jgi:hypothetical protein
VPIIKYVKFEVFTQLWLLREVSVGTLKIIDVSEERTDSTLRVEDLGKQEADVAWLSL